MSSPYQWDLANLYVTGEATLVAVPGLAGDFDQNGVVDGADFLAWQRGESTTPLSPAELAEWQSQFGVTASGASAAAVPEPAGVFFAYLRSKRACRSRTSAPIAGRLIHPPYERVACRAPVSENLGDASCKRQQTLCEGIDHVSGGEVEPAGGGEGGRGGDCHDLRRVAGNA